MLEGKAGFLDFSMTTKVYGSHLLRYLVFVDLRVLDRHVRGLKCLETAPTSTLSRRRIKMTKERY